MACLNSGIEVLQVKSGDLVDDEQPREGTRWIARLMTIINAVHTQPNALFITVI